MHEDHIALHKLRRNQPLKHAHRIAFGATVTMIDEDTEAKKIYQIVGESEADVKKGRVSITSPTARALIGKKVGDHIEVQTPGGGKSYEILQVAFV